jgi:N6-L-threonylcarbamoyladenine synthase
MNILGIETSCDETAAAVVQDGRKMLSNVVASQIDIHAQYGGVVPEVAARSHLEVMLPVVEQALSEAFPQYSLSEVEGASTGSANKDPWDEIDGIAVTAGPGLLGSLLIGTLTARTLAELKDKPLYAINHVEAHIYANWLIDTPPSFPVLALVVSGGHSQIVLLKDHMDYQVLGQTQDDAAGEAFDKIAKLLDLGFPGGPAIAKAALEGDDQAFTFPKAKLGKENLDYSFSGVKTAVLRKVQELVGGDHTTPSWDLHKKLDQKQKNDIAASFQKTVVDTLVDRLLVAYDKYQPKSVVIAGGVAANQKLREELKRRLPIDINYAPMHLCTDNAAMIASLGYYYAKAGKKIDPKVLAADSSLSM